MVESETRKAGRQQLCETCLASSRGNPIKDDELIWLIASTHQCRWCSSCAPWVFITVEQFRRIDWAGARKSLVASRSAQRKLNGDVRSS
ncbi:unnamed protein product [Phytophthora fragariaefolia]|uniref:Unnamed protein product n=1 Tax=Phytophthora fragariaefolia TaxID=1490495 RepID=A0A9W7CQY4_9STRA|nr:unnamed protein product [Phytophthora fragariaefolia]